MGRHVLLSYIVNRINASSRYYMAEVARNPRLHYEMAVGTLVPSLKRGLYITLDVDECFLPMDAFVFETDIQRYVTKISHSDRDFADRLSRIELNADDIEDIVRQLTNGRLKLYMKGRRKFEDNLDDD